MSEQTNVFTYTLIPSLWSADERNLNLSLPKTQDLDILPYEQTTLISKLIEIIEMLINFIMSITAG